MSSKTAGKTKISKRPPYRPTKWKPQYNDSIVAYFDHESSYVVERDERNRPHIIPKPLPTFEEFAKSIGVTHATLLNWAKENHNDPEKYPDFFEAYTRARELQESFLITAGFAGASQPNITMFLLKNKYSYRDTFDHTNDSYAFEPPIILNPGGDMTIRKD